MKNNLWKEIERLYRGQADIAEDDFLVLSLSTALIHKSDNLKIESLLHSNDFSTSQFTEVLRESAEYFNISIPSTMSSIKIILERLKITGLNDFLFSMFKLFKKVTIHEFSKELKVTRIIRGKEATHSSSSDINNLALKILELSNNDSFLDPACGYGNTIVSILEENSDQKIFGQEINHLIAELAKIRTILLDGTNTKIAIGDVLDNPQYVDNKTLQRFDKVYSDSPIGLKKHDLQGLENDPYNRFMYGLPPKSRMDWAFISNGISSLNETGKGIFVTSLGPLFRAAMEQKIRRKIVELDLVEAVIALPSNLLEYTAISTALLVINKNKSEARKGKILMINAEDIFTGNRQRTLSKENIEEIYELYSSNQEINKKTKFVLLDDLEEDNLLPSRYIVDDELETSLFGKVKFDLERFKTLKTVELGEVAEIKRGYNIVAKDEDKKGNYSFIKIADVEDGVIDYDKLSKGNVRSNTKVKNYQVQKGDLLISVRGTETKLAVVSNNVSNVLFTQNFNCIRPTGAINSHWLKLYLESPVGQYELNSKLSGSNVVILQTSDIASIKIPVLEIEEQKKIVTNYQEKMSEILKHLELIKKRRRDLKLQAYSSMGLDGVFEIEENV